MAQQTDLMHSQRGPRSSYVLATEPGVYALFLRDGFEFPNITPGPNGLIYIGLAANKKGLRGRCHFAGKTRNHSPRKSLAALLMDELKLVPVLITKPNSGDTWGLDADSEARLTAWMHENLDIAVEPHTNPDARESELILRYAPPLNLAKCPQTAQHRLISQARSHIKASLSGSAAPDARAGISCNAGRANGSRRSVGADFDTANAIAARFCLDPKSYRQQLRSRISWYRKPQDWTFPVNSQEWRDMIAVAGSMTR